MLNRRDSDIVTYSPIAMQLMLSLATIRPFNRCIYATSVLTCVSTSCFCSCKRRYRSTVADKSLPS